MKHFLLSLLFLLTYHIYSQDNGLKNYRTTLKYNSVYNVDLDINTWKFLGNYSTNILFDINEKGSGRIIIYYVTKNIYYVTRNYKINYSDGSSTYFFVIDNGNIMRLGVTPDNHTSAFSLVLENNITITFSNR